MAKAKTPAPPKVGRPPSPFRLRTAVRHNDAQIAAWKVAAAQCGLTFDGWARAILDGESRTPKHMQPLARSRRG